jgi:D-glycero-alpha-D-manno-heptose-7-phosphate kinase
MTIYRSRAPVRITFGGGGTDIAPYDKEHGGMCLGATINRYCYCSLRLRKDKIIKIISNELNIVRNYRSFEDMIKVLENKKNGNETLLEECVKKMKPNFGFELYVRSDISPSSGLGSSASVCVATLGLFNHLRKRGWLTKHQIAEHAFKVEEEGLKNLGGRQDQYAATFGGINLYEFAGEDNIRINPINARKDVLLELEKNLLVVSTGNRTKTSGEVHKEEKEQGYYTSPEKVKELHKIKQIAEEMEFCLREGHIGRFGELIKESWEYKKSLNPKVTNERINLLIETALKNGAIGARLMGAGGGGHLLIFCQPNKEHIVAKELANLGAKVLDFSFDFDGLQTWEVK